MSNNKRPHIAVVQFPGVNCEDETARALAAAGARAEIVRFNCDRSVVRAFDGYVLPGGFSYEDRVRAGAVAAKDEVVDVLAEENARGKPVLGICNGAQVLIEAGLVPAKVPGRVDMALAHNRHPYHNSFLCRWVYCRLEETGDVVPLPIAHAEGRFASAADDVLKDIERRSLIYLRYVNESGERAGAEYNPNGAVLDAAAVRSLDGTALAVMPHPERACWLFQLPTYLSGPWGMRRRRAGGQELFLPGPGRQIIEDFLRRV